MAAIKKLASQTLWYGASSIGARMLNYLLTPLLVYLMSDAKGVASYGDYNILYGYIAVANIIFTYGFETGYFRFSNKEGVDRNMLFQTTFGSLLATSVLLVFIFSFFLEPINHFLDLKDHAEYIFWALLIIALDTVAVIPFAKLRQENRPRRYAFIKVGGIVINILFVIFFLVYLPMYYEKNPNAFGMDWYFQQNRVGLLLLSNLLMNVFVVIMLFPEWSKYRFHFDKQLWKKVFKYSAPMIVIGLAGMINEVMDRQMIVKFLDIPLEQAKMLSGIYSANYKLAIFITLFIQAFKLAAEPFFFKQAKEKDSPNTYANLMMWFVATLSVAFLVTMLYIDVWKHLILTEPYWMGLGVVPILLFANISLGIYYNLSVWYKITDKMRYGVYITIFGALITIVGNYIFIPKYGMYAAAWSTFACYTAMVLVSYITGKRHFPVPYPIKKIVFVIGVALLVYGLQVGILSFFPNLSNSETVWMSILSGTILLLIYIAFILKVQCVKLSQIPYLNKFVKK